MASLDLDLCPEFDVEMIPRRSAITTPIEGGPVRFRERNERTLRAWRLRWKKPSTASFAMVMRKFRQAGTAVPLNFTVPRSLESVEVFFLGPPKRVFLGAGRGTAEVEIEERR